MTFESWIQQAIEQAGTLHPGLAGSSANGAIYFVGCTFNIALGAHADTELPKASPAGNTEASAMPATIRPTKTPGMYRAE